MTRRAVAVVFMLMVSQALLSAQDTVLSVSVPSADVYRGPSTVTPVIGHVSRGTALPVSQNLGSWVKVPWPDAPDGVGYVHVTMGRLGPPTARPMNSAPVFSSSPAPGAAASTASMPPVAAAPVAAQIMTPTPTKRRGVPHVVGIGGLVASPRSVGATARFWANRHLGVQVGLSRDAMTSDVAPGRVTSMQFEPGVIYAPADHVSDYVWFRPYMGSVVSFRRQTLSGAPLAVDAPENGVGFRAFGGGELMFSSLPRFGVSVEVGYRRFPILFDGFEADRLSTTIAGHWYIR